VEVNGDVEYGHRMKVWHFCVGTMLGLALGCGGSPEAKSPRERLPENVILRVDRVDVAATQPGTQNRWDGPEREPPGTAVCSLLALGTNLLHPVSGEHAEKLCGALVRPEHRERFAEDPDLRVRLRAGASVSYDTPVVRNLASHSFTYEFVVPIAAVPPDGLGIEVLDDDGKDGAQSIGVARMTLEIIANTWESSSRMFTTSAGALSHLEVVVAPYTAMDIPKREMLASSELLPVGRRLAAGEIVHLRAEGSYTVGKWYDAKLGPRGHATADARRFNFPQEPFASAPHAAGIALAGENDLFVGALVAPCVDFTSLYAGVLRVGINDTETVNNEGKIAFEGLSRAPTPEEWGKRVNAECR
jgi:hypothetical protein